MLRCEGDLEECQLEQRDPRDVRGEEIHPTLGRSSIYDVGKNLVFLPAAYRPTAGLQVAFGHHLRSSKVYYTSPTKFGGGGRDTCPLPRQTLAGEVVTLVHY